MENKKAPPGDPAGRRAVRSVGYNTPPTPDGKSAAPVLVKRKNHELCMRTMD
jgi:hypothetical protein